MDNHGLIKRLDVPDGWPMPSELNYGDIGANAVTRDRAGRQRQHRLHRSRTVTPL
jgi:hypothetical protein